MFKFTLGKWLTLGDAGCIPPHNFNRNDDEMMREGRFLVFRNCLKKEKIGANSILFFA
jgi:hypothetical protein